MSDLRAGASGAGHEPTDARSGVEPTIQVRGLRKSYGDQVVLDGIDLDVMPGETMVVMGGSGSGKTTLLRHLTGAIHPDRGSVSLFGRDLAQLDSTAMDETRKRFGILFQSAALFNSMTLAENVALPLEEHTDLDRNIIEITVKIKLELVGLREHADKFPDQLSGGMRKRAGLARALALDPRIIYYDEPSAGLDPVTSAEIDQLIVDLSQKLGVTSVVITHEMDSAFTVADRMAMLDKGRILRVGPREEFDRLRGLDDREAESLGVEERIIRQFVRGDANGPITERKALTNYADDLLGALPEVAKRPPSLESTRG